MMAFKNLDDALAQTTFFVRCNNAETQNALWILWVKSAEFPLKWRAHTFGFWRIVGPTTACVFSFAHIMDRLVCFYFPISKTASFSEMEAFFAGEKRICDAKTFPNCIVHLKMLKLTE